MDKGLFADLYGEGQGSAEKSKIQNSNLSASPWCGSAPVPAEVLKRFEATFNCLVIEGYGLNESASRESFNPPNANRRPGSCGQPIGNEMKIVDENDNDVADGELGEIVLRGENIFKGYYKNPEATAKAFAGGWFHTGDIGYRDADGFFYIADRKSDMIIRGGEKFTPARSTTCSTRIRRSPKRPSSVSLTSFTAKRSRRLLY